MQYRILGPFYVARDGVEVVVGSGKQRALLAVLLLRANEAVSTDRLIDQLWGEARAASSTKVLQNCVSRLRRLLGDGVLITRGHGYELRVERGELDLDRFEDQVAEGREALAVGDPARAAAALSAALALWHDSSPRSGSQGRRGTSPSAAAASGSPCSERGAEWQEWNESDGPRWRFWHGHAHFSDQRWLAESGLSLDEVLRGDAPDDPPGLWDFAA